MTVLGSSGTGWLQRTFVVASEDGTCVDPRCTTCGGATQFFALILRHAARQLGLSTDSLESESPHQFVQRLSASEWGTVRERVLDELAVLDGRWYGTPELELTMSRFGLSFKELGGSDLVKQRKFVRDGQSRAERQRRVDRSIDRGLTQERRWDAAQTLSKRRLSKMAEGGTPGGQGPKAWGDPALAPFVAQLRKMPPSERLEQIASQTRFRPTELPADLIPLRTARLSLSPHCSATLASALAAATGEWGELAERLQNLRNITED